MSRRISVMSIILSALVALLLAIAAVNAFVHKSSASSKLMYRKTVVSALPMSPLPISTIITNTLQLCDTSISEEEVLSATGELTDLPNPLYAVGLAAFILIGVGLLQFTLGDLTKEVSEA